MEEAVKESPSTKFKVLMLPWLAHGHISPFLELSKTLVKRNFQVYFCSTEINLDFIKKNSLHCDENSSDDHHDSVELVQLHLPEMPELPPHYHTTKNLPPHLRPTLGLAFQMAMPSFSNIIDKLNPDLIIYDSFQLWVPELAALKHIPCVHFAISSAASECFFSHVTKCHSFQGFPFSALFLRHYEIKKIMEILGSNNPDEQAKKDFNSKCYEGSCEIVLIKSWREVEGKYLDHLSLLRGKKMVPLGPLIDQHAAKKVGDEKNHADLIKFLNSKDQSSVVYVSFGSECFLSKEDREEIAHGLELISNVNFIWVIRFPVGNTTSIEEALPEGFLERVKERGMVVDGWAPQAKILEHSSVGGFVSHCGWSSTVESLHYGVPIIGLPMLLDQPLNARLLVEIGAGVDVVRGENGQIKGEVVAEAIKMVVLEKSGEQFKEKVKDLSKKLREKGEDDLNEAVEMLRSLCSKEQSAEINVA